MGNWRILATNDRDRRDREYFGRKEDEVEEAYDEGYEEGYRKAKEEMGMRVGSTGRRMNYRYDDDDMDMRRGGRRGY